MLPALIPLVPTDANVMMDMKGMASSVEVGKGL